MAEVETIATTVGTPYPRAQVSYARALLDPGDGTSNLPAAALIFLSHRTVGSHLDRIFPKLGISNRNQLRDVLPVQANT